MKNTALWLWKCLFILSCGDSSTLSSETMTEKKLSSFTACREIIYLGGGCFWCVEAVFIELNGVCSVTPGYMGGSKPNPTYREVCTGLTGHAEVVRVEFDPLVVSVDEVLEIFWKTHDPTTLNRQGNDVGPQYRSVIFCTTEEQFSKALQYKNSLNKENVFASPVVTEISMATPFYAAEDYHKNYPKKHHLHHRTMVVPYIHFLICQEYRTH